MIVYWSILAYTCIVALIGCAFKRRSAIGPVEVDELNKRQHSISLFFALLSVLLIVIFAGMRSYYGDTSMYITEFKELPTDFNYIKTMREEDNDNIGFWTVALLFKRYISDDVNAWFFLIAIFQVGAVTRLYYKYSENFAFSYYLFITAGGVCSWLFNGMKQFTAVCMVLYFFDYVVQKKLIKFLLVILVAYFFHKTAVLWIPVYFIVQFKPFSWQIWVCVFLTLLAVFFVNNFTNLLNDSLEGTKYEGNDISSYNPDGDVVDDGVNPIRVLVYAVPPAIALWRRKIVDNIDNRFIDICINLSTVCVGVYLLGVVTSGILIGRIPMYFEVLNYILLPWLLKNVFSGKFRIFMVIVCVVAYFIYFYYAMVIQKTGYYASSNLNLFYYPWTV